MIRLILTTGLCLLLASVASSVRMVCFYNSNAATRASVGVFTPSNINPKLCTHIIYGSSNIDNQHNLVPTDATSDPPLYSQLNNLKSSNPQLKTLLSVGGPTFDSQRFAAMVASAKNRQDFITTAVALLKKYNFDGLNLDWRYPTGNPDNGRFTTLCQELRTAFNKENPVLLLSASVSAVKATIDTSYEIANIHPQLDFINVLTFDFHSYGETVTAHHSPLYARSTNPTDTLTTHYAMNYWKTNGVPAAKLNLGIAAYGRAFKLTNPSVNGVGAPASGTPDEGCYSGAAGLWSYYETCLYIVGGTRTWLSDQKVPYDVTEGEWVGYDDSQSLDEKVAYINANSYGGAWVWSVDLDDYTGQFCKQGSLPFLTYLHNLLLPASGASNSPSATTSNSAPANSAPANSAPANSGNICNGQSGVHPNPADRTTFYNCDFGKATLQNCSPGLVFKTSCKCCDLPKK